MNTGIPFIDNALGIGPAQEAARQNAQQNYAHGVNKEASDLAQSQQLYQWFQMMQRYQQQVQNNPNPAQTWNPMQGPSQIQGSIGGGQIGPSGNPQAMPPQAMRSFMPTQAAQFPSQQNLTSMQPPQQPQPQPQPHPMGVAQGLPLEFLQHLFAGGKAQ